jgi:hypothetical protein
VILGEHRVGACGRVRARRGDHPDVERSSISKRGRRSRAAHMPRAASRGGHDAARSSSVLATTPRICARSETTSTPSQFVAEPARGRACGARDLGVAPWATRFSTPRLPRAGARRDVLHCHLVNASPARDSDHDDRRACRRAHRGRTSGSGWACQLLGHLRRSVQRRGVWPVRGPSSRGGHARVPRSLRLERSIARDGTRAARPSGASRTRSRRTWCASSMRAATLRAAARCVPLLVARLCSLRASAQRSVGKNSASSRAADSAESEP